MLARARRSAWDPQNPKVFVPHAFGVGWSVNFARVAELIRPPVPPAEPAPTPELTAPARKELTDGTTPAP